MFHYSFRLLISFLSILLCLNTRFTFAKDSHYGNSFNILKRAYLGEEKFINNEKIKIIIQEEVEEAHEVSMVVKFPKELKINNQVAILVDNNPIQLVTKIFPDREISSIGLNIRLEQDSLVRAAILSKDNIWNVSSKKL